MNRKRNNIMRKRQEQRVKAAGWWAFIAWISEPDKFLKINRK